MQDGSCYFTLGEVGTSKFFYPIAPLIEQKLGNLSQWYQISSVCSSNDFYRTPIHYSFHYIPVKQIIKLSSVICETSADKNRYRRPSAPLANVFASNSAAPREAAVAPPF